jgi:hypothetical protein
MSIWIYIKSPTEKGRPADDDEWSTHPQWTITYSVFSCDYIFHGHGIMPGSQGCHACGDSWMK